ncbi:MAG: 4Fe-4S dicluster domain-containing protein [Bacteroidales bacterium]|jgi:tetrathionate reductase subunit B|nr:4Fe-4S dicluster domain-containing protein [Bacteroidales bacterium]
MAIKKENVSRRDFLKKSSMFAGGVVFVSLLNPFKVVYATKKPKGKGKWYGIAIDIEKCIGCGSCARACKTENNVPNEPFFFRNWVEQYTITNDEQVMVSSPNGGIDGFKQAVPDEDIYKTFFVPKMCNHCAKSPCTQVCPVGASFESPEGLALVDQNYCIGCGYCVQACPYGCRYIDPAKGVVDKCTLCYHRLQKDLDPACMMACPTGARIYGDLNDRDSAVSLFIKEYNCAVLKPQLNTDSKLYYYALSQEVH